MPPATPTAAPAPTAPARRTGRPAKYGDAAARKRVLAAIRMGTTYEMAAQAGGISHDTLTRWRGHTHDDARDGADRDACTLCGFCVAFARAEAEAISGWLSMVAQAMPTDWRAAAWMLERRYPHDYGKQTAVTSTTNGVIEVHVSYTNDWRTRGTPEQANTLEAPRQRVVIVEAAHSAHSAHSAGEAGEAGEAETEEG